MPELEAPVGNMQPPLPGVLPRGTLLRGYEVQSVLGKGAFGITYRAVDATLHRGVAIKEYLPTTLALREGRTTVLPHSPDHAEQFAWGRERFLDEARTLARLNQSAIVRVHDFLEANGTAYMVMALIEGETLNKRLMCDQRLMPDAVERLIFPLLDGLEEVHGIGFLHRDIKPANIMIDEQGLPTLIDFGAARAAMVGRSTTMTAIFTPGYAAPEQFMTAGKLGPWSDIYGVASTLYHAITGRIPPSGIDRIIDDVYEPLSELRPQGFAPELLAGIDAGMAVRATDRPQSIAEWCEMLSRASRGMHTTQIARKPSRLPRAARRAGRLRLTLKGPALWGSLAAAIVLLGGAGYLAWINPGTTATTAVLSLSAEQLEQALAERRKADTFAAEKRRLVEEAQGRAEAEAEANRRAERELQEARLARQNAESELAQLKADSEAREARRANTGGGDPANLAVQRAAEEAARHRAEAAAAAWREAESEAQTKAAAEAESNRLANEALAKAQAEQQQAEVEANRKAEVEAAKRKADEAALQKAEAAAKEKGDAEAQKKVAEAAEKALRLEPADRERLQLALTSLGFDTRGRDGVLGPRSREMIAAWQKARNQSATGFLTAAQHQALLKEAAPAVGKFDDELKQAADEKRLAAEARPRALATIPAAMMTATADGLWRGTYSCGVGAAFNPGQASQVGPAFTLDLAIRLINGSGLSQQWMAATSNGNTSRIELSVDAAGTMELKRTIGNTRATLAGKFAGNSIRAAGTESGTFSRTCTLAMTREPEAAPTAGTYDGAYAGDAYLGGWANRLFVKLSIANGRGAGTMTAVGCNPSPFSVSITPTSELGGEGNFNCVLGGVGQITGLLTITGRHDGNSLFLTFWNNRGTLRDMRLARQPN